MNYSTPATRSIQWGHAGITFLDRKEIVAVVDFPVGSCGPFEDVKFWKVAVMAWTEYAMLPEGAYFPAGIPRSYYSRSFILEVR
jgi:hypothetical protein